MDFKQIVHRINSTGYAFSQRTELSHSIAFSRLDQAAFLCGLLRADNDVSAFGCVGVFSRNFVKMASDDVKMSRLLKLAQKFNCFYLAGKLIRQINIRVKCYCEKVKRVNRQRCSFSQNSDRDRLLSICRHKNCVRVCVHVYQEKWYNFAIFIQLADNSLHIVQRTHFVYQ